MKTASMTALAKIAAFAAATMLVAPAAHADEYQDRLAELRTKFRASDTNQDGRLTQLEARNGGMTRIAANFSRVDTDRDGYVTLAQLEAQLAARFN
jgi:Ca2+-binding EF-hand superfamily protein